MQMDNEARELMGRLAKALLTPTLAALKAEAVAAEASGSREEASPARDAAILLLGAHGALLATGPAEGRR